MPQFAAPPQAQAPPQAPQSAGLSPEILSLLQMLGSAFAPQAGTVQQAGALPQTGTVSPEAAPAYYPEAVPELDMNTLAQLLRMLLPAMGLIGRGQGASGAV